MTTEDPSVFPKSESSNLQTAVPKFHLYKERWYIALVVSLLQITNGAFWLNFAPIANHTASYFKVDNDSVNWLSMVYFVTFGPFVFVAMWIIDEYGLKNGIRLACVLNIIGSIVRNFGTAWFVPEPHRYTVTIIGQTIASLVLPVLMSLPTKVSQDWFGEKERTMATTICAMTSPVGSALGSFIPPLIVKTPSDVPLMNDIFCISGIVAGLLGAFCTHSRPPTPPNVASKQLLETNLRKPYFVELKKMLTNIKFIGFMITSGGLSIGISSAISSILQQMLCSWGYSNTTVGVCNGLMIGSSIPGSILFTYLTDKTKRYEEIIKIGFSLSVPAYAAFVLVMGVSNGKYILGVLSVLIGIMGSGLLPICLEIAVEDNYPVDESITSGLILLSSQVQAAIYVPLMGLLSRPLTYEQMQRQTCTEEGSNEAYDMTYSGILMVGITALCSIYITLCYWPKYRRMEAEKLEKLKPVTVPECQ